MLLTDGPAAEIKEQFGGYTLVECADLDEALSGPATLPAATVTRLVGDLETAEDAVQDTCAAASSAATPPSIPRYGWR